VRLANQYRHQLSIFDHETQLGNPIIPELNPESHFYSSVLSGIRGWRSFGLAEDDGVDVDNWEMIDGAAVRGVGRSRPSGSGLCFRSSPVADHLLRPVAHNR
jgi:hypothetical protein